MDLSKIKFALILWYSQPNLLSRILIFLIFLLRCLECETAIKRRKEDIANIKLIAKFHLGQEMEVRQYCVSQKYIQHWVFFNKKSKKVKLSSADWTLHSPAETVSPPTLNFLPFISLVCFGLIFSNVKVNVPRKFEGKLFWLVFICCSSTWKIQTFSLIFGSTSESNSSYWHIKFNAIIDHIRIKCT